MVAVYGRGTGVLETGSISDSPPTRDSKRVCNVCNNICEFNDKRFKRKSLYLREIEFMKDKEFPEQGLEKVEKQLSFFRTAFRDKDAMKYNHCCGCLKSLRGELIVF